MMRLSSFLTTLVIGWTSSPGPRSFVALLSGNLRGPGVPPQRLTA